MKLLAGLLLLPFCAAVTRTVVGLVRSFPPAGASWSPSWWGFVLGFGLWVVLFLCLPRPVKSYVFAHELTHALWGWALGARVGRFRVSARGGSVELSKSNFLITLAPYFFPLYAILVLVGYGLLSLWFDLRAYEPVAFGLLGLTWAFHLTFTLTTLRQHQPDIRIHGRLFSYGFIYLLNLLGIGLWIVGIGAPTLPEFAARLGADIAYIWMACSRLALWLGAQGRARLGAIRLF